MFRKCIVLVLVMIFAAGTALAQDAHLEIELTVQRTDNENKSKIRCVIYVPENSFN